MAAEFTSHAGSKIDFSFALSDYPASEWDSAVVVLRCGSAKETVTLTASGDTWIGSAAPATTAGWAPGLYELAVTVTKTGDRQVAYESQLALLPDPGAESVALTALEAELAAVDTAIAAVLAGQGVASYTIQTQAGSRQIQRMSLEELRDHRRYLEGKIDAERATMGQTPKNQRWKRIGMKFV